MAEGAWRKRTPVAVVSGHIGAPGPVSFHRVSVAAVGCEHENKDHTEDGLGLKIRIAALESSHRLKLKPISKGKVAEGDPELTLIDSWRD